MIPFIVTPTNISVFIDGRMRTVGSSHINFNAVSHLVKMIQHPSHSKDESDYYLIKLRELVDIPSFIAKVTEGRVKIGDAGVMFDNEPVRGVIADRLVNLLKQGFDIRPLARFLERLKMNPTETAIDEVYLWLESGNMPLTEDGCFLAFKKVRADFTSSHPNPDGTYVRNAPGDTPSMSREEVDPDRSSTCSRGLHFCSEAYLPSFGVGGESRVVVLKVAPEDVVSIPYDYNNSKGRAWRYAVLAEVPEDECAHLFKGGVVNSYGLYDGSEDDVSLEDEYDEDDDQFYGDDDPDEDDIDPCVAACVDACQAVDPDCPLIVDPCCDGVDGTADPEHTVVEPDPVEGNFTHNGRAFSAEEVKQLVADYGQRGMARLTGVPRTTVQEWIKRIG